MPIKLVAPGNSKGAHLLQEALAVAETDKRVKDLLVHWGTTGEGLNGKPKTDGLAQLTRLRAAYAPENDDAPFYVPTFTTDVREARRWAGAGKSVWGRLREHTKGRDIVQYPRSPLWAKREFWVQVVQNVEQEWRIHVVGKNVIGRGLKVYAGVRKHPSVIRSRNRGWRMRHDIEPSNAVREAARAAVAAVGYDFGAVDLLLTRDGSVYVLEVNKQPGLDNYTAGRYANAFVRKAAKRSSPGTPRS